MSSHDARGKNSLLEWRTLPWAVTLFLVAAFQLLRGAWVDAGIFAVTLALLLAGLAVPPAAGGMTSTGGMTSAGGMTRRRITARSPLKILIPVAVVVGAALALAPRHGGLSGGILVLVGLAAVGIAWFGATSPPAVPDAEGPARRPIASAVVVWSTIVVVAGLWEATAYLLPHWGLVDSAAMPAISDLLDPVLNIPLGKALFILLWLAAGVALLRRGWRQKPGRRRHRQ